MRILLVNKFHYLKGGSEKYYFELGKLLEEHGNEVAYFSMENEKNISTGNKEYFVKEFEMNAKNILRLNNVIYSKENYKKMIEAIEDFKPDIIHLNNFQRQLSASVVKAAYDKKIPMVFTAHDLQAICPAISMLNGNNEVCEKCIGGHYENCLKYKCNRGSKLKSIIGKKEGIYYRKNNIFSDKIKYIITPTKFYGDKFIEDGYDKDKIKVLHNFIELKDYDLELEDNNYILYSGRLSKEKGILNLIEAIKEVEKEIKNIKLYIAGDGPEKDNIIKIINENKLDDKIILLGYLSQDELRDYTRKASFTVIPSIWYENCPYSALETQAIGKPIIGAKIGGIPELVIDGKNGIVYKYDDVNELVNAIKKLWNDKELRIKYSENAKQHAKEEYNKEKYYNSINEIYNKAIEENRS